MEIFLIIGIGLFVAWILSLLMITILSLITYRFDKKEYTHPKWHTIFPYHFKIQYKVKQKNGQKLVYTNTPYFWEFPFLGDSNFSVKREVYTKEWLESDDYKNLRKGIDQIFKNQKRK